MEVLGAATRTRLKRYSDAIAGLSSDYPEFWWLIAVADIKMRRTHLERIRRRVRGEHLELTSAGLRSPLDLEKPWDLVFREAARDLEYWQKEVDKKVVQFTTAQRSRGQLIEPGFGSLRFAGGGPGGKRTSRDEDSEDDGDAPRKRNNKSQGDRRRAARQGGGYHRAPPPAPHREREERKGKGKGKEKNNDAKSSEGKYFRSRDGKQLCWAWNKAPGGCTEPCPKQRTHLCEWCRGEQGVAGHRTCGHSG